MHALLLALCCHPCSTAGHTAPAPVVASFSEGQEEQPDEEELARVAKLLAQLEEALGKADDKALVTALAAVRGLRDQEAIDLVARSLKHKAVAVRNAALETLRYCPNAKALVPLHTFGKRTKVLRKDAEGYVAWVKATGQHGSPTSIELLSKDIFGLPHKKAIEASILALGNIRHADSVHALFATMQKVGKAKVQPVMESFQMSLIRLTGEDFGRDRERWLEWYRQHKKTLTVAEESPPMPKLLTRQWEVFWGLERTKERSERKGRRGEGDQP